MNYNVFLPQTYRMDIREERDEFIKNYQEGEVWISKPTACNRGIGIYLLQNKEDIEKMRVRLEERENKRGVNRPAGRIVSRYILYPLLLNRRKFDVRSYVLIRAGLPWGVAKVVATRLIENMFLATKSPPPADF